MYRLVDMVCSAVKELLKTDPQLWPNSPTYKADLLDEMISTVMDQQTPFGQSEGLTKSLMRDLMQDVMQIAEHDKDHWLNPTYTSCFAETQREINGSGGPVKEVITNLLVMTKVDRTQALRSMDETDRRVITMIADAAKTGMLQKLSEHGAWIIKGKYTDCPFTQGKLLDAGVSNEQLDLDAEKVQEANFETTAGRYEILAPGYGKASKGGSILTDSEEDSSDSESEADKIVRASRFMTPEWRLQFGYPQLSEPDPVEQTQTNTTTSKPPDYKQEEDRPLQKKSRRRSGSRRMKPHVRRRWMCRGSWKMRRMKNVNSLTDLGLVDPTCAQQRPKLIWRLTCMTVASESFSHRKC